MKKKSVRRPIPKIINSASQPTDLLSLLRSLSTQTHLELTDDLQNPLMNKLKTHISKADIWEMFFEAAREANRVQGWKR